MPVFYKAYNLPLIDSDEEKIFIGIATIEKGSDPVYILIDEKNWDSYTLGYIAIANAEFFFQPMKSEDIPLYLHLKKTEYFDEYMRLI